MNHHSETAPVAPGGLTSRQCEVLDLLLQHRTSKEIARQLAISPHTVEQRIRLAKEKLGVHRRSDLASAYRELQSICGKSVYEESFITSEASKLSEPRRRSGWNGGRAQSNRKLQPSWCPRFSMGRTGPWFV